MDGQLTFCSSVVYNFPKINEKSVAQIWVFIPISEIIMQKNSTLP